jgi:leucyl aminopeptidase
MHVEITAESAAAIGAELLAVPFSGAASPLSETVDALVSGRLGALVAIAEAKPDAGSIAVLHVAAAEGVSARRVGLVGVGRAGEIDADGVRTAAAAAARAAAAVGGALVWGFDPALPLAAEEQVRAVVEGATLGAHDPARWKTGQHSPTVERLVLAGAPAELEPLASRAALTARWTNRARELVDGPPNEVTPAGLADAAATLVDGSPVEVDVLGPDEIAGLGMAALGAVGRGSANPPRLIVLRYPGAGDGSLLGLVGKGITFDSGGLFLKPQSDIVRQKADMAGAAAVIAAVGAIAELRLAPGVLGVVPAAENMLGGGAFRPGDIVTTAAGLTVEVTNPDAEGRLVLAEAIWYARREGATRVVDLATLTGAMRAGMGDLYAGVFANDETWRSQIVEAGTASGDHAWPWPLHRRYRRLLDSPLADLRNTAGRSFGYPIVAAAFLERFTDGLPWAHIDIQSTALLDEDRDYLGRGASGAGVRLLVELVRAL